MSSPNRILPIIAGTMVMTLIQIIPLLNLMNLVCCSGILLGGFTGVYVYKRQIEKISHPPRANGGLAYDSGGPKTSVEEINFKDGGMIGLLCGILSAILVSGFSIMFTMFSNLNPIAEFYPVLDQFGFELSPEIEEYLTKLSNEYAEYGYSPTLAVITFISNLIIYPLFGTIGALIGVAVFKKKPQPNP